ncbi:MAG: transglutaminase domain-containing protein [Clostridia bacterium]|nr:transglutaminase domain-containing protein [Clostridia bacterium]
MNTKIRSCILFLGILLFFSLFASCKAQQTAPEVKLIPQKGAIGVAESFPKAEDFFESLPAGATVRFSEDTKMDSIGQNRVTLILRTKDGKEFTYSSTFTLMFDDEAPVISGAKDLATVLGDGVAYRSGVTVTDNLDPAPVLSVNTDRVDLSRAGSYPVVYEAKDFAGNTSSVTVYLHVYRELVTKEMLNELLAKQLSPLIGVNMSTEERVRVVYQFVYQSISYQNDSDKSDWVRAAYYGLVNGYGDCFTYFALSKACFEYLGIENLDIQRTEGIVTERHYWNLVNLGNNTWYHFDACHLLDKLPPWGCLMTDAQLEAYSRSRAFETTGVKNYFYAFDGSAYPKRAETIITEVH